MPDHTSEVHKEKAANTQPVNPRNEIVPAKDTPPIDSNPATENIEVHPHAYSAH